MHDLKLDFGVVLSLDNEIFRIIDTEKENGELKIVNLIQLNISKFVFKRLDFEQCFELYRNKRLFAIEDPFRTPQVQLDSYEMDTLEIKERIIKTLLMNIHPYYESLQAKRNPPRIACIIENYYSSIGLSKAPARILLLRYLQSGKQKMSLIDGRKHNSGRDQTENRRMAIRGAKDAIYGEHSHVLRDDNFMAFCNEISEILKKNPGMTFSAAYREKALKYYADKDPVTGMMMIRTGLDIPTKKRVRRNILNNYGVRTVKEAFGNPIKDGDDRILTSRPCYHVVSVGDVIEIDEEETDIQLVRYIDGVSENIGKPIIYFMVDVFSGCIVGASVDLENNSYAGFMKAYESLFTLHSVQAQKNRIIVPDDFDQVFPSCFIPGALRCDQGAEYMSKALREALTAKFDNKNDKTADNDSMGTRVQLVSVGTGSLKGAVEAVHNAFKIRLYEYTRGKNGFVSVDTRNTMYEDADLTLNGLLGVVYEFIYMYNQRALSMDHFTDDMILKVEKASPIGIWDYGIRVHGHPAIIYESNIPKFKYAIMKSDMSFSMTKKGVIVREQRYISDDKEFLRMQSKAENKRNRITNVRYDPNDISYLYMSIGGKIIRLDRVCKNDGMQVRTWKGVEKLQKEFSRKYKAAQEKQQVLEARAFQTSTAIIADANIKAKKSEKKTDGIKLARSRAIEEAGAPESMIYEKPDKVISISNNAFTSYDGNSDAFTRMKEYSAAAEG